MTFRIGLLLLFLHILHTQFHNSGRVMQLMPKSTWFFFCFTWHCCCCCFIHISFEWYLSLFYFFYFCVDVVCLLICSVHSFLLRSIEDDMIIIIIIILYLYIYMHLLHGVDLYFIQHRVSKSKNVCVCYFRPHRLFALLFSPTKNAHTDTTFHSTHNNNITEKYILFSSSCFPVTHIELLFEKYTQNTRTHPHIFTHEPSMLVQHVDCIIIITNINFEKFKYPANERYSNWKNKKKNDKRKEIIKFGSFFIQCAAHRAWGKMKMRRLAKERNREMCIWESDWDEGEDDNVEGICARYKCENANNTIGIFVTRMVWCFPKWMLLLRRIFLFYFIFSDFLLRLLSAHTPGRLSFSERASLLSMARICVHANHSFYYYLSPNTTNKGSGRTKRSRKNIYIYIYKYARLQSFRYVSV